MQVKNDPSKMSSSYLCSRPTKGVSEKNRAEKTRGQDDKKAKDGKYFHDRCDAMSAEVAVNLRAPVGPMPNVSEPDSHPCK